MNEDKREVAKTGAIASGKLERLAPDEEAFYMTIAEPVIVSWSNGEKTEDSLANMFGYEEDYKRYTRSKSAGESYPVKVEPQKGSKDDLLKLLCEKFTEALNQYYEDAERL